MSKKPVPKLPYDVPWILQRFRAFLLGREHRSNLRWAKDLAPKTQPQPELPPGACSKICFNYYCDRDPRGEVERPRVLYDAVVHGKRILGARTEGCRPLEKEREEATDVMAKEEEPGKNKGQKNNERAGDNEEKVRAAKKEPVKDENVMVKEDKKDKQEETKKDNLQTKLVAAKVEQKEKYPDGKPTQITSDEGNERKETSKMGTSTSTGHNNDIETSEKTAPQHGKESEREGGENQTLETVRKEKEKEENISDAVKRVPGKVWHWDCMDGQPDEKCCTRTKEER